MSMIVARRSPSLSVRASSRVSSSMIRFKAAADRCIAWDAALSSPARLIAREASRHATAVRRQEESSWVTLSIAASISFTRRGSRFASDERPLPSRSHASAASAHASRAAA